MGTIASRAFGPLGLVRMSGRDSREAHRAASPLELFFDLVFVVAVSQASQGLHHGIAEGEAGAAVLGYGMIFFAIWWAWMNFTWFASAFDVDDWLYRLTTIVQMGGVLVLATGVQSAMAEGEWAVVTWGYVIMRLAMVAQWARLAISDPEQRSVAIRYALGIVAVQLLWLARLLFSADVQFWSFWPAAILEMLIPVWAERARNTPWHPHHIAERYGCFTLIVLGESLLASSNAVIPALGAGEHTAALVGLAVAGIVIAAGMWWVYFSREQGERLGASPRAFAFGYAHYFVFASAGAVSAGIEVELDLLEDAHGVSTASSALAFTLPVAVFLVTIWLVMLRGRISEPASAIFLIAAALVLACGVLPVLTVAGTAVCLVIAVVTLEWDRLR
ncbi:low temperature requirement protein A [Microbacterium sp. KHB019]|uniref:low temperature requirement protein A n=1 Tax=Microbacterium sp. KHB019 TaxID=3129770 RepID=UPI00307A62D8